MLLQAPVPVESRCPRRWLLAVAGGLLGLAVLGAGLGLRAQDAPAPEKKAESDKQRPPKEKPERPRAPDAERLQGQPALAPLPNYEELLRRMTRGMDPVQAERLREQMRRSQALMREQLEQHLKGQGFPGGPMAAFGSLAYPGRARLGAVVAPPSETLVEQLDLPRGQGVVLQEVTPQSAADKAGLKAHDILLELAGKPVSSKVEEFARMVQDLKAKTPLEAVVLRKGKRETIKGLSLPEVKAERAEPVRGFFPALPNPPAPAFPGMAGVGVFTGGVNEGVMTTTFRNKDRFTARHQEGSLIITVTGKVEDGKPQMKEIRVQDGSESHQYKSVEEVPERYRDKVKNLVEMTEKSQWHIDIGAK